jgi:hypothetical protein
MRGDLRDVLGGGYRCSIFSTALDFSLLHQQARDPGTSAFLNIRIQQLLDFLLDVRGKFKRDNSYDCKELRVADRRKSHGGWVGL